MDYEKKYKEANDKVAARFGTNVAKEIFADLYESEDERIGKVLVGFFKSYKEQGTCGAEKFNGIPTDDILSWLEKQGEPSIKWNKNTEGNKPQVNHSVLMKTTHGIAEGEWQGEYWHQYRWASIVRDSDVLSWIELSDLEKLGEQKSIIEMKIPEESLGIDSET